MFIRLWYLLANLLTFVVIVAGAYLRIMSEGSVSWASVVDAFYFSIQTVTTVGYGNWIPVGVSEGDPRIFWVKVLSLPAMLIGAVLFTVAISRLISFASEES